MKSHCSFKVTAGSASWDSAIHLQRRRERGGGSDYFSWIPKGSLWIWKTELTAGGWMMDAAERWASSLKWTFSIWSATQNQAGVRVNPSFIAILQPATWNINTFVELLQYCIWHTSVTLPVSVFLGYRPTFLPLPSFLKGKTHLWFLQWPIVSFKTTWQKLGKEEKNDYIEVRNEW